jgi:ring-1,2-phenylacetyl-CoA epoxidase subunit PaaB
MSGNSDTQWPPYEVFVQEKAERPFQSVGAVHAADAEMALLNARTVFVRRPVCHSLWVVPSSAILMRTAEELATDGADDTAEATEAQRYQIFQKTSQRRAMVYVVHVGEITAVSPHHALQQAIATFGNDDVFVWWVVPTSAISSTDDDDIDSFFEPALDKTYRQPSAYRTFTAIRKARSNQ